MTKKYIKWVAPDTAEGYTHMEVWVSTDGTTYTEFTALNDPAYTANGILISDTDAIDLLGSSSYYYKIRPYDSVNAKWGDYSDPMRGSDMRGYCTISEVRGFTNVQSAEYSDAVIQTMIDTVTSSINRLTGRTWQGVETVTDEYLDGSGDAYMFIHNDLVSVSAISVDETESGTYTTVTPSYAKVYSDRGGVYLDPNLAEVSVFPANRRAVKISYTYGNSEPTDDVKHLALLMVANTMKTDPTRYGMIAELKRALRSNSFATI